MTTQPIDAPPTAVGPTAVAPGALDAWCRAVSSALRGVVRRDEPLAAHTSWKTGGPADIWAQPADEAELRDMVRACAAHAVPWMVLGKGSNALVADAGVRGVVFQLDPGLAGIEERVEADQVVLQVGGGTPIAALLRHAAHGDLVGVEQLTGIPGSLGGTLRMNGGTHLGELADALIDARIMLADGAVVTRSAESLGLRYRQSDLKGAEIVVSARLRTQRDPSAEIARVMREVKERRRATQPLTLPSGGSTFVNPPGDWAWRLVDAAGLRGAKHGGAQVSPVHPNFIVNDGTATSSDIAALIRRAQTEVHRQFGVWLRTEICWIGDWPESAASGSGV